MAVFIKAKKQLYPMVPSAVGGSISETNHTTKATKITWCVQFITIVISSTDHHLLRYPLQIYCN